jgi:hypothetical protein
LTFFGSAWPPHSKGLTGGDLADAQLSDPNIAVGSVVGDLYNVRNCIADGDKIPNRYMVGARRCGTGGPLPTYGVLFEVQSFIIRSSLPKILRDGLQSHFSDATSAEAYFGAQGLTKENLFKKSEPEVQSASSEVPST